MERHRCKLCHRRFGNGRALGAHMKAHLSLPRNTNSLSFQQQQEEEPLGLYGLRENPKRSLRFADSELSFAGESSKTKTTEEDVAMCLMMLSRDVWTTTHRHRHRHRNSNRCDKCKKVFRTHQAMCSHNTICQLQPRNSHSHRVFQCPYCCKVFGSGQALGGHKRSHHINTASTSTTHCFIDLNLPPPPPLEEDNFSVLSDA